MAHRRSANVAPANKAIAPTGVKFGGCGINRAAAAATTTDDCDDYSYNQPQMHGSVGMGVVGGNHFSGNYQTGTVNLSKAFGSCDHPSGGVSISIGGGTGHFNDRRDH